MSLPRDVRAVIREAMAHLPTWRREERRIAVIRARKSGLTVAESARAAGCSIRHAKRLLQDEGLYMGRSDRVAKAAPAAASPNSHHGSNLPPAPARAMESVEESRHRQMVEAHDRHTAATEAPAPPPPAPTPPHAEKPPGILRSVISKCFGLRDEAGFEARSSDGQPAHRYGTRGEGTVNAGARGMDAANAIMAGHQMSLADYYKAAGVAYSNLEFESKEQANARALDEAFFGGSRGSGREAVSHGNLPGLGSWIRERNAAPSVATIRIRRQPTHKFIGHRPDGSTYEF